MSNQFDEQQQQQQDYLSGGLDNNFEFCQPVEAIDDTAAAATDDPSNQPKQKKQKVECSIANCTNTAQSGGICIKHGGKYISRRYYCTVENCTRLAKRKGPLLFLLLLSFSCQLVFSCSC